MRGDDGYSVVEAALTIPVLLFFWMLAVQAALLWHGRHVAESAARDGLEAARGYQARDQAGQEAAFGYLRDVAPHLLQRPAVTVNGTNSAVRVTVRARIMPVIPGIEFEVSESAEGPIERFISLPVSPSGIDILKLSGRPGEG